jgi:hypothetical protein
MNSGSRTLLFKKVELKAVVQGLFDKGFDPLGDVPVVAATNYGFQIDQINPLQYFVYFVYTQS